MDKQTVLVTGSAGRIGREAVSELKAVGHDVRGFDHSHSPGAGASVVGEITDRSALDRAMVGVKTLIHLAATPDDDDFLTTLIEPNIAGVYHVFEAARQAGVQRMVLASSGQMNWYQRQTGPWPIKITDPITPRYWYAATKAFLEAAGRGYSEAHGMSVIVARLGWCPRTPEQVQEIRVADWAQDVYLSPGDAGRFFACCVAAPATVRFAIVFATSKPVHKVYVDPTPARELLRYEARDSWPTGVELPPPGK